VQVLCKVGNNAAFAAECTGGKQRVHPQQQDGVIQNVQEGNVRGGVRTFFPGPSALGVGAE
jgi:hypothetical protein